MADKITKKEIIKDINKLIVKVEEYNNKQKPHSNAYNKYFGDNVHKGVYDRLCYIRKIVWLRFDKDKRNQNV